MMSRRGKVCGHCQVAAAVRSGRTDYRPAPGHRVLTVPEAIAHLADKCRCAQPAERQRSAGAAPAPAIAPAVTTSAPSLF